MVPAVDGEDETVSALADLESSDTSIPWIKILSAVPMVRRAILVQDEPVLTVQQTKDAHALVKRAWDSWLAEAYRSTAARISGVPISQLAFDPDKETVRYRMDGKTPMIDLPRLRTRTGTKLKFDQRSCVALCTDKSTTNKYSSKVWTRVGPPELDLGCAITDVREWTRTYRRQANACCKWFYDEFISLTKALFEQNESTETGGLEVTTVGLQVKGEPDDDYFDDWLLSADRPNVDNPDLFRFLADAADVELDLRDIQAIEPDSYWMSIPNTVELPNGDLASRRFLYLVRPIGDQRFVVGVGFDDSGTGELAGDVALKISRFFANRI